MPVDSIQQCGFQHECEGVVKQVAGCAHAPGVHLCLLYDACLVAGTVVEVCIPKVNRG